MITHLDRGVQARRRIDARTLAGVPLRRKALIIPFPAPCARCQDNGEMSTWAPLDGGYLGEFTGMAPCSCPAGAALREAEDLAAITGAGGEPAEAGGDMWGCF